LLQCLFGVQLRLAQNAVVLAPSIHLGIRERDEHRARFAWTVEIARGMSKIRSEIAANRRVRHDRTSADVRPRRRTLVRSSAKHSTDYADLASERKGELRPGVHGKKSIFGHFNRVEKTARHLLGWQESIFGFHT